jgi:FkbM family methyltransferase
MVTLSHCLATILADEGGITLIFNALPWVLQRVISKSRLLSVLIGRFYWGLDSLDKKVIQKLGIGPGYYVELGAADGISQSNTKHLEVWRRWSGILIEPSPINFGKLIEVRSKSNLFVNAGCVSFGFPQPTITLTYSNLMTIPLEGNSDIPNSRAHAKSGQKFLRGNETVHEFEVEAKTLNSILDEAKAPNVIDFMSLDVEGSEMEVLQGVDHTKYRFKWVLIESRSPESLTEYMKSVGYELDSKLTALDYLFFNASRS